MSTELDILDQAFIRMNLSSDSPELGPALEFAGAMASLFQSASFGSKRLEISRSSLNFSEPDRPVQPQVRSVG
jgi:hypothetical protein